MTWNWQRKDWGRFTYDTGAMEALERKFLQNSGVLFGAFKHLGDDEKTQLTIDLISDEALKTSEIEGEILNRDSLQSSIRQQFGLQPGKGKIPQAEQGIADLMVDLYRTFDKPLTKAMLFRWHKKVTAGRDDLRDVGRYRTHQDPMQVVSGYLHKPKIHFEAPPSSRMKAEMDRFIDWFHDTLPKGKHPLPILARAGIAHLYFVSIHPFEDGNGRIGRALAEKALAEGLGQPTLIALSQTIQRKRKLYYDALERANKDNDVTDWLIYFAQTLLEAERHSQSIIEFLIGKTKFYACLQGQLNTRQEKALARMFVEGVDGFKGGLSAEKYIGITQAPRATATRDLQDLVAKGALTRTGELRHTRYWLNLPMQQQREQE